MTTLTEAPNTVNDILPARPTDGTSRPAREAVERAQELSLKLRTERDEHFAANHQRAAELVEAIDAGKSPSKILATIADSAARITELDHQLAVLNVATGRLRRIHSEAVANDTDIRVWRTEVQRIKRAWTRLDHQAVEDFPVIAASAIRSHNKGEPVPQLERRHAWLESERLRLADSVTLERFRY